MRTNPIRICHLLGHKRVGYDPDGHPDNHRRHGRQRRHSRCTRCGTSDAGEVYRNGLLENLHPHAIQQSWRRVKHKARTWWRTECEDCKQPTQRFGRPIGQHDKCDVIPF